MSDSSKLAKTVYGRRKMSPARFAEQQAKKVKSGRAGTVFGKRRGGPRAQGAEPVTAAPQVTPGVPPRQSTNPFLKGDSGDRVSIAEVERILDERPELLDLAIETECQHADPRRGAIRHLRKLESERPAGPRASVMKLLARFG